MIDNTNENKFDFDAYIEKCTDELRRILVTCAENHRSITLNNLIGSIISSTDSIGNGTLLTIFAHKHDDYERLIRQYCSETLVGYINGVGNGFEVTSEVVNVLEYAYKMYYKAGGVTSAGVLCAIVRLKPDIMLSKLVTSCSSDVNVIDSNSAKLAVKTVKDGLVPKQEDTSVPSSIVTIPINVLDDSTKQFVKQISYNKETLVHRKDMEDRVLSIISKEHRPFVLLVGDEGCGKKSLIRSVVDRLQNDPTTGKLYGYRAVEIDNKMMMDGGIVKMGPDKRMESTLSAIASKKNYLTVINDLHMYEGVHSPSGYSIYLALSGDWSPVIATVTPEGLKELDSICTLTKLFTIVNLSENDTEFYKEVLRSHASYAYRTSGVETPDEVIETLYSMNERYVGTTGMPGTLVDLFDLAIATCGNDTNSDYDANRLSEMLNEANEKLAEASHNGINEYNKALYRKRKIEQMLKSINKPANCKLSKDNVRKAVSNKTGIDVTSLTVDSRSNLSTLKDRFENTVIGQGEAVTKVTNILKKMKLGLGNTNRTRGNILFVGPSGVGKTLVAKEVAKELFGDEKAMLRIDMSEYSEKHSVSRLIGAPPGYVGYSNGGQLTSAIAAKSNCLILLDEVEKAHPDIFDIFLQVFDDGRLTDGRGKTIDFRNCFFIMTSNLGTAEVEEFGDAIGFDDSYDKTQRRDDIVNKAIRKRFKTEFINRIDAIVNFNSLSNADLKLITNNELVKFSERVSKAGYALTINDNVADFIAKSMTESEKCMGARPIIRKIETMIEDKLADAIIRNEGVTDFEVRVFRKKLEVSPKDTVTD